MQIILRLLLPFMAMAFSGCSQQQSGGAESMPAVPVIAVEPLVKDVTLYAEAIGTLAPAASLDVRPQVSGTINGVLIQEGQFVDKGTPLFTVSSESYAIRVREAQAQLAMDRTTLESTQKKLSRYRSLADKDLVSRSEWDDLEADAARAEAAVQLDEARLRSAQLDLEDCTLTAPIDGRVGKVDIHPGHIVANGQPEALTTVAMIDRLLVEFTVTEKELAMVKSWDSPIEIQTVCSGTACVNGRVTFLDNSFDPKTGLLLVRARVDNPGHALRPGQAVRVRIPTTVIEKAKLIPQKAVRYNPQGPYVYIVQPDNTVTLRQIILGDEQGKDQIVLQGVDPEEKVVVDGHLRLSPGTKVEIKE